ncbi:hypothetical protein C2G38_1084695 [Gigaspora rosea]|uniref:Uncharacterized protein n=1 Tax=Gigaspora rosea TaxID=44941 RepID=A0A397VIG3_9GLOM|nr:hypothetical protein C2G38_1084695 [Gigaspora rosea]
MRWNDPLLSYVVNVSKCDFLRHQFTVNEWNQIAQNPNKYNIKLDVEQIKYIRSCYEHRKNRIKIRQLMREGETQDFQEFVTEIFVILTNIWERKDLNELNEGTWEILFMTPLIEIFKRNNGNHNKGICKSIKGEKGSKSSLFRKQLQKQQEKLYHNKVNTRAESWHTVNVRRPDHSIKLETVYGDQEILFEETSGSINEVDMDKLVDDECKLVHFASDTAINRHNKILLPNERFIPDFESFCCRLEKLEIFLFHLHETQLTISIFDQPAFPIGRVRDLFHIFIPSNENSTCDSIVNFIQALWAVRVGFNEMISEFLIINEIARESRANLVGKFHDSAFILDCKKFLTFASPKRGSS